MRPILWVWRRRGRRVSRADNAEEGLQEAGAEEEGLQEAGVEAADK